MRSKILISLVYLIERIIACVIAGVTVYFAYKKLNRNRLCPHTKEIKITPVKDGQKCLDESFPLSMNSTRRVAMEGDNFVVLERTAERQYHGYVIGTWDELNCWGATWEPIRKIFRIHGLINKVGKNIK